MDDFCSLSTWPHLGARGVGGILDSYANPRRSRGFAQLSIIRPTPLVFCRGYVNTEKSSIA